VSIDRNTGHILLDALPACIVVRGSAPEAEGLRSLYKQLISDVRSSGAGSRLAVSSLIQLIFLQVIRFYTAQTRDDDLVQHQGWLGAGRDLKIAEALKTIHSESARTWTLEDLAKTVSMSRTTFAKRFRIAVGDTPLNYIRDLRLALAAKSLSTSNRSVASIAYEFGYSSEAAFSSAFKKTMKVAPKHFRDAAKSDAGRGRFD
jgi:AraC-like DNA-binding protein